MIWLQTPGIDLVLLGAQAVRTTSEHIICLFFSLLFPSFCPAQSVLLMDSCVLVGVPHAINTLISIPYALSFRNKYVAGREGGYYD
jgi:hypothetical protein